MIFKRFAANLKAQNWFAISIELFIVVVGVFVGTQVSNWNDERRSAAETRRMLADLQPEIRDTATQQTHAENYYTVTRAYGDTAFAGWRGDPRVSDEAFVIAAYQASQITWSATNSSNWAEIFGSDRLRTVEDPPLRRDLSAVMSYDIVELEKELFTSYRTDVRKVIPEDIQDAIRAQCGDRRVADRLGVTLPTTCDLAVPDARFAQAADLLRANPQLVGELRWHFAAIATYLENITFIQQVARRADERLTRILGQP